MRRVAAHREGGEAQKRQHQQKGREITSDIEKIHEAHLNPSTLIRG